jgi:predicted transcriptional regulator
LELNETEEKVFRLLVQKPRTCEELSKKLQKDKSSINRILNNLKYRGLITKKTKCCKGEKRGRYFVYSTLPRKAIKDMLKKNLDLWYSEMKNGIQNLKL